MVTGGDGGKVPSFTINIITKKTNNAVPLGTALFLCIWNFLQRGRFNSVLFFASAITGITGLAAACRAAFVAFLFGVCLVFIS